MATSSNDKFCSLDMLAEVASATLINDSSLSFKNNSRKTKLKIGVNTYRKSINSSDRLTLDQIKALSDKMLIEMFSELTCDEIRKNYSFKCFLIPEKCSQIFKSFGSEARARCKMKMHLQCHISDLSSDAKGKFDTFTAEPLHIRRKRLKELNSKNVRQRKKNKQITKQRKGNINHFSEIGSSRLAYLHESKSLKYSSDSLNSGANVNINCSADKTRSNNQLQFQACESTLSSTYQVQSLTPVNNELINVINGYQDEYSISSYSKNHWRRKIEEKNNSQFGYTVKWDTDFDNASLDNSNVLDFDASYYVPNNLLNSPFQHDHCYTSVHGKTYCDIECHKTCSKGMNKKPLRYYVDVAQILPSPPFPFVYIPLLPHASEVQEIYTLPNKYSKDNLDRIFKKSLKANELMYKRSKNEYLRTNKFLRSEELNEDCESVLKDNVHHKNYSICLESTGETSEDTDNITSSLIFNLEDLETDCPPNLQSVEKELALKFIQALRLQKKEERGPLICQICKNKSFTAQATLLYHYRSHAGIKPFSCTVCDATFTRQHSLKYHMLIHYNKTRFLCNDCGRSFRHPSHFKEHLRRHTGETPYECTDCNLRFKTRNTYKRHLKTRHGKILTMNGIHHLPDNEFNKVKTNPGRKDIKQTISHKNEEIKWWNIFQEREFL